MVDKEKQISMITWQDAAFSFEKSIPSSVPEPRTIFGVIIREASDHIFIATNLYRDMKTNDLIPVDGMLIPRGVIREVRHLSKFHD
ncbi:MAG: hypothetical protein B7X03_01680 [Parcubacteria group bacterium 21-58-10]|nr:MAG: hypothetical protein B7X03_01680 [Parcubacteria group bacterium 21-58-10]